MPTTKELVLQAQTEQLGVIATNRLAVLKSIDELDEIGGKDNYVHSLKTILAAYPNGIRLSRVQEVMGDAKVLAEARETLKAEIEEIGGKRTVLKLRTQPESQTTE
jgi:hypothetical protein